ncbi:MAG: sigma-54 dependent transcriptional regulator [Desulfuromonadaceae bacterium]|nr:sigma-54 dependent transcriptional regulator [Desulfuromonadaceae bacterium]MDD2847698.1 sigma-54 dependent transcriptional regulator [Desulfuromonadaceae bacterium]MDD4131056.1 sigma-54 dependent transcriptional regulator [Desulfuromonadaceae bacterium]
MVKILIIDDDQLFCKSLSLVAQQKGYHATSVHTLADGFAQSKHQFDVVFLDVNLPDGSGLDYIQHLSDYTAAPEIIIITGQGDPQGAELAIKCGAWDYIEKGASVKEITLSLQRALQYREQKIAGLPQATEVDFRQEGIIGSSSRLKECLALITQAALSDASVLITGATGTGKELFARAVHRVSPRSAKKYIVVDCAAMPDNLIEGILFGHEKGSFTSADQCREGLVSQADGGTLFLDEIGEMPLSLQKVFLRVLQEHRFRPIGSVREQASNFRLVAATNRNLQQMVQEGTFRADLLFRISTFMIELPGLHERTDDIPLLIRHHADRICAQYEVAYKDFSPEFMSMLEMYSWPGNVRELVNTLERTIAVARNETVLFPKHLPIQIRIEVTRQSMQRGGTATAGELAPPHELLKLQEYRDTIYHTAEKKYLNELMELTDYTVTEACRISGLSSSRLYALLKKQDIPLQR